jgi:hypothetical protein
MPLRRSNAALEWQAGIEWWRSRDIEVACPLEGLVRSVASPEETPADRRFTSKTHATSAYSLTLALN